MSRDRRVFYVTKHDKPRTLFVLVPISYRLATVDTSLSEEIRADVLRRMENVTGVNISSLIEFERIYGPSDFRSDFHAWRGVLILQEKIFTFISSSHITRTQVTRSDLQTH